jgi:hypothetical protein
VCLIERVEHQGNATLSKAAFEFFAHDLAPGRDKVSNRHVKQPIAEPLRPVKAVDLAKRNHNGQRRTGHTQEARGGRGDRHRLASARQPRQEHPTPPQKSPEQVATVSAVSIRGDHADRRVRTGKREWRQRGAERAEVYVPASPTQPRPIAIDGKAGSLKLAGSGDSINDDLVTFAS